MTYIISDKTCCNSNHTMFYNVPLYVFTGKLSPPQQFQMNFSNISVTLSWVPPNSLQVSTPPTISHYVLSNNLTNGIKTINNPTTCKPLASCSYSFDLRDPFFKCAGFYGGENMTILGYNVTILFTFFAVNGAGNGDATTFAFIVLKETPQSG